MKWMNNSNKKYTQISIYVIITAIIIYCLSLLAKNAPSILSEMLKDISWILGVIKPLILGFIFAYLLQPVVDFLEQKLKKIKFLKKKQKSCRGYAILITLLMIFGLIATVISLLVYSVTDQLRVANFDDIIVLIDEYSKIFSDFYNAIITKVSNLDIQSVQLTQYIKQVGGYILTGLQGVAMNAVSSISNLSSYLTTFLFALIITIYFLADEKIIKGFVSKVFHALFSEKANAVVRRFLKDADTVFSGYIRGQLADACVMMIMISLSLSIIHVKFALVIGILAGIGNLVPYFGPIVAYIGTIVACLVNGQYKQLLIALIVLFIIQTIDGNIIGPKLLSNSINIHPLLVVVSLIFGSAIGGFLGMLLAVPVGAFLKLLFVNFIDSQIERKEKLRKEEVKLNAGKP